MIVPLRSLKGARVVLAGRFGYVSRDDAAERVRACGGLMASTLSRRTHALVIGALGWPIRRDGRAAPVIERAEALNASGAAIRILSERRLMELMGLAAPRSGGTHTISDAAAMLEVEPALLERWRRLGLICAGDRLDFQDLVSLRTIADLVSRGVQEATISATLVKLSRLLPGVDRPLSQLRVLAESPRSLVVTVHDTLQTAGGQLLLAFDEAPAPGEATMIASPEAALDQAVHAEEAGRLDEALRLYDRIIEGRPRWEDAHFNRGNALLALGEDAEAARAFRRTIELAPDHVGAWYNLSEALERMGQDAGAESALEAALAIDPIYQDAIYNLASLRHDRGLFAEAAALWRRYLQLDPSSEWATRAREALAACTTAR